MRQSKQLIPVVASTSGRDKGKFKGTALTGPKHATAVPGTASGAGSLVGRVKNGVEAAKRGDEPSAGLSKSSLSCCFKHHDGCNDCSVSVQANHCSANNTFDSLAYACSVRNKFIMCCTAVCLSMANHGQPTPTGPPTGGPPRRRFSGPLQCWQCAFHLIIFVSIDTGSTLVS